MRPPEATRRDSLRATPAGPGRRPDLEPRGAIAGVDRFETTRLPVVHDGLVVVESDGLACRVASMAVDGSRMEAFAAADEPPSLDSLGRLLARVASSYVAAVVVTPRARPEVRYDDNGGVRPPDPPAGRPAEALAEGWVAERRVDGEPAARRLVTRISLARRAWWSETLAGLGLRLEGIYPLEGTAASGVRSEPGRGPRLLVQLERGSTSILETRGDSLLSLEIDEGAPSLKRCVRLIGEGCPEVSLCGGGADLSELGCRLVLATRTWVRLPGLRGGGCALPESCASMVGAALHASRIVAVDAIACVPPPDA